jgi:death-on-curing protein
VEYLTINEALLLHARLIQLTGGSPGIRDMGLLEPALARPQATFDGVDLYPDLWAKAASLMHALALNHPFVDGNERTALAAVGIFLGLNGFVLTASNDEALDFTRQVTVGGIESENVVAWLEAHSQVREHSDDQSADG